MKHVLSIALLSVLIAAPAFAHGDNDHVRGTVAAVTAQSIIVTTTGAAPRTLSIDEKTTVLHLGKAAHLTDVKVGDRVVIDVPKKTDRAEEINFSTPAPPKKGAAVTKK